MRHLFASWLDYGIVLIAFAGLDYIFTGGTTTWSAWDIMRGGLTLIICSFIGLFLFVIFGGGKPNGTTQ